ncbi:hypothetical protein [Leeia aquatica]|uniref:Uncharacterized protein n=1 Tax=Leeia aquatica TaxID=2725557 RepID=A0A847SI88_9NEIS|nr:hypothetical protein [Leeia aquatica]NLR75592.1 hypothetical protein [Leeia aquatica]
MSTTEALLARLQAITDELQHCSHAYPELFPACNTETPEGIALDNLLLAATHETASQLSFLLQDIHGLHARLALMAARPQFTRHEQVMIGEQGWSLPLLQVLHQSRPTQALDELSQQVKAFHATWQALPKLRLTLDAA